jgi:Ca2+/Na+ antiporter
MEFKKDNRLMGAVLILASPTLMLSDYFKQQERLFSVSAVLFFLAFLVFGLLLLRYRRVLLDDSSRQVELIDWTPFRRTTKKLPFDDIDCVAIGPEIQDPDNDKAEIPARYLFLKHQDSLERITHVKMLEPNAARLEAERIAAVLGGLPVRFVSDLQQEVKNEQMPPGSTISSREWRDYVRPARPHESKLLTCRIGMVSLISLGAAAWAWTIHAALTQSVIRDGLTKHPLLILSLFGGFYSFVLASLLYKRMAVIQRSHGAESLRVVGESLEVTLDSTTETFGLRDLSAVIERRDLGGRKPNIVSPLVLVLEHDGLEALIGVGESPEKLQELLSGLRQLQSQL